MLNIIELLLFVLCTIWVGYLFVFSLYSLRHRAVVYPKIKKQCRMAVLMPSYREDAVIMESVRSVLRQDYPSDLRDVVVISDRMLPQTNMQLKELPIKLLEPSFEQSTKAKSLAYAIDKLKGESYDIVVILDADNLIEPDFMTNVNQVYNAGIQAMQAHRIAKNRNTDTAILDAVSEEINNSIFRSGHVNIGLSAALSGSGMAFDYKWFEQNIAQLCTSGEDKELEILLLSQGIYIEYLDNTTVLDEKTGKDAAFYNQRRRWLAAQFAILSDSLHLLPKAIMTRNIDLCDKLMQWTMPPRILLLALVAMMSIATIFINWELSIKWWLLTLLLLFALAFATPDYLVDKQFKRAIHKIPLLALMMFLSLFRLRGMSKKFTHTKHGA